jgi:selenocysteine lyase/cysteine desulfurase
MIYLDNSAGSFPKAPGVAQRMAAYIEHNGANVGRGSYPAAVDAGMVVTGLREKLAAFFDFDSPARVIFTPGQTFSLNLLIKGLVRKGDHVIVTPYEHNAVMRPLNQVSANVTRLPGDEQGLTCVQALKRELRPNTRLVIATHASNVSGMLQPVAGLARLCRESNVPFVLDAAQSAGHLPLSFRSLAPSALCVPGHKGMLGPAGIAALLMDAATADKVEPLVTGGTGSGSEHEVQPRALPERFEAGTLNLPGIFGLDAAVDYLMAQGVQALREKELAHISRFLQGLAYIEDARGESGAVAAGAKAGAAGGGRAGGFRLLGSRRPAERVAVFSFDFSGQDNAEVALRLEQEFGLLSRSGLHCAPAAHRALGTFPQGTVRLSFSTENSPDDVDAALAALAAVGTPRLAFTHPSDNRAH